MRKETSLPPFGLWAVGLLFIMETVNLRIPRVSLYGRLSWNDAFDGIGVPVASCLLAHGNFSHLPFGLTGLTLLCLCLKMIGSGAHAVASGLQTSLLGSVCDVGSRSLVGQFHALAHWLGCGGELGLLALLFWHASPRQVQAEDAGIEMPGHILASVHGLVAGTHAVSTKTTPLMFLVWIPVAIMTLKRWKPLSTSMMRYAYLFCFCSCAFVCVWGIMHNGSWPTFEDANEFSASLAK